MASLCHVAWAQVLARCRAARTVVFGTVLFGRMQAARAPTGRWACSSTRCRCGWIWTGRASRRACGARTRCWRSCCAHEHASLALAQRCSGVAAPAPLFTALLNYRHSGSAAGERRRRPSTGVEWLGRRGADELSVHAVGGRLRRGARADGAGG